jgi:hypothetical protein
MMDSYLQGKRNETKKNAVKWEGLPNPEIKEGLFGKVETKLG